MPTAIVAATWLFQALSLITLLALVGYAVLNPSRGHAATAMVGILLFVSGMLNVALASGAKFSMLVEQIFSIISVLSFGITAAAQIVAIGESWLPKGETLNRAYGSVRLGCALLAILGITTIGVALSNKQIILPNSVPGGLSIAVHTFSLCTLWAATLYAWGPTHTKFYSMAKEFHQKRLQRALDAWRLRCYMAVLAIYTIMTIVVMALSAQYNNVSESLWLWTRLLVLLSSQISVPLSWLPTAEYDLDQFQGNQQMYSRSPLGMMGPMMSGESHIPLSPPPPVPAHASPPKSYFPGSEQIPTPEEDQKQLQEYERYQETPMQQPLLLPPMLSSNDMAYRIPSVRISGIRMSQVWNDKNLSHS
ncbi:hypothetical protein INT44_001673 [Umbelopsis vinacea]|uniref:Uncharacterized protein n=1 Tax=Umbelopsis vinacea TaxID=44442 RepID=A0A8H7UAM8_9FUNG|nr:hypothetical protein INT44_001673 [Umbelopsis vinacea]